MFIEFEAGAHHRGCTKALIPLDNISVIYVGDENTSTVVMLRDGQQVATSDDYAKIAAQLRRIGLMSKDSAESQSG